MADAFTLRVLRKVNNKRGRDRERQREAGKRRGAVRAPVWANMEGVLVS